MGLHVDFGVGDTIIVSTGSGDVQITLQEKTGRRSRVTITADSDLPISIKSAVGNEKVFSGTPGGKQRMSASTTDDTLRGNTHGSDHHRG